MRLPWWSSGWESTWQCRRHEFAPWSRKIAHPTERLSPIHRNCWAHRPQSPSPRQWESRTQWPGLSAARRTFFLRCFKNKVWKYVLECPHINGRLLLLLRSRLSRVWLCATPLTAAHQAGILQARTLEWVAISSNAGKGKVKVKSVVSDS